jgi:hypothetical protein
VRSLAAEWQVGEGEGNGRRNESVGGLLPHPMNADDLSSALISILGTDGCDSREGEVVGRERGLMQVAS